MVNGAAAKFTHTHTEHTYSTYVVKQDHGVCNILTYMYIYIYICQILAVLGHWTG